MKKFYTDKKEMTKDYEEMRKDIIKEYNLTKQKIKKRKQKRKKNLIAISIIIITFLIVFKLTIKNITFTSSLPSNDLKGHTVSINNIPITINVEDIKKTTIIPYFIYKQTQEVSMYYGENLEEIVYPLDNTSDKYILDIKTFDCFLKKHYQTQTSCTKQMDYTKKETTDTTYNLTIQKHGKKESYNGPLIKDITPYVTEEGYYNFQITATYDNTTSTIFFTLRRDNIWKKE